MSTPAHYHPQIFGATPERMTPQPNPAEPPCRIPRPPTGSTCEPLEAGLYPGGFMLVYDNSCDFNGTSPNVSDSFCHSCSSSSVMPYFFKDRARFAL